MCDTERFALLAVHTHEDLVRALFRAEWHGRFREYVTYSSEGPEHTHVFRDIEHALDELHVPHRDILRRLALATDRAVAQPHLDYFLAFLVEVQAQYDIFTGRKKK
jgi:hypothetical protein